MARRLHLIENTAQPLSRVSKRTRWRCLLFGTLFLLLGLASAAKFELAYAGENEAIEQRETTAGRLDIVRSADSTIEIRLEGQLLKREDVLTARVASSLPKNDKASLLLIEFDSGGVGCPAEYSILDLTIPGDPRFTEMFGNCSDVPHVEAKGEGLIIEFPPFAKAPAQRWSYRGGQLSH
jgi:hypothetical protein